MTRFAKLAALGAWGVVGALVVAFVVFVLWLTRPNGTGIDRAEAWIAWISMGCVVAALEGIHVVFARILRGIASGRRQTIESAWLPPEPEIGGVTAGPAPRPL